MDGGHYGYLRYNLDLIKAFDTVNHSILLRNLSAVGAGATACDCFESFLQNRPQVTHCNNTQSDKGSVSIGVAQGSILGALLFIIYINDLPKNLEHCNISMYIDDTVASYFIMLLSQSLTLSQS